MNWRSVTGLLAVMGLGFVLVPGSAIGQGKSLKEQLVGTWQGVSIVLTRADGTKIHPFGEKLNGALIFTADGHLVVLLTRSDLPKIAANNRLGATPDEARAAYRGSYGFFGPYTVDEAEKSFTLKVLGSTYPNEVGADTKRMVTSVTADELKFTNAAGAGGGSVEATFRRSK